MQIQQSKMRFSAAVLSSLALFSTALAGPASQVSTSSSPFDAGSGATSVANVQEDAASTPFETPPTVQADAAAIESSNKQNQDTATADTFGVGPSSRETRVSETQADKTTSAVSTDDTLVSGIPSATGFGSPTASHPKVPNPQAASGSAATETATSTKSAAPAASSSSYASSSTNDDDTFLDSWADFTDFFDGLKGLFSPTLLLDIESFFHHVAYLLDDKTTDQTKALIGTASGLLTQSLIDKLTGLLDNASALLTADFVHQIQELIKTMVPILKPELFKEISELLDNLVTCSLQTSSAKPRDLLEQWHPWLLPSCLRRSTAC